MGLIVGENSYVNLSDALEYIADHYEDDDVVRVAFEARSEANQASALISSASAIDKLLFQGRKARALQPMAFPRTDISFPGIYWIPSISPYYDNRLVGVNTVDDGLKLAIAAQIENALWGSYLKKYAVSQAEIVLKGIRSQHIDNITETYDKPTVQAQKGIFTEKVYSILRPWLSSSRFAM